MADQIEIFAQEARRIYYGGDPPIEAGWRLSEAIIHAKQALSEVALEEFREGKKLDNQDVASSQYLVNYPVNLALDAARQVKYALLPDGGYLALPNDRGFHQLAYNYGRKIIPQLPSGSYSRPGGVNRESTSDYYCEVEGPKVLVYNKCVEKTVPFTQVFMTLAIANEVTAQQAQGIKVVARTLQIYASMKPNRDMVTDNNPTPQN